MKNNSYDVRKKQNKFFKYTPSKQEKSDTFSTKPYTSIQYNYFKNHRCNQFVKKFNKIHTKINQKYRNQKHRKHSQFEKKLKKYLKRSKIPKTTKHSRKKLKPLPKYRSASTPQRQFNPREYEPKNLDMKVSHFHMKMDAYSKVNKPRFYPKLKINLRHSFVEPKVSNTKKFWTKMSAMNAIKGVLKFKKKKLAPLKRLIRATKRTIIPIVKMNNLRKQKYQIQDEIESPLLECKNLKTSHKMKEFASQAIIDAKRQRTMVMEEGELTMKKMNEKVDQINDDLKTAHKIASQKLEKHPAQDKFFMLLLAGKSDQDIRQQFEIENKDVIFAKDDIGGTPLHIVCRRGHYKWAEEFLQNEDILPFQKDIFGRTPYDVAKRMKREEICQLYKQQWKRLQRAHNEREPKITKKIAKILQEKHQKEQAKLKRLKQLGMLDTLKKPKDDLPEACKLQLDHAIKNFFRDDDLVAKIKYKKPKKKKKKKKKDGEGEEDTSEQAAEQSGTQD